MKKRIICLLVAVCLCFSILCSCSQPTATAKNKYTAYSMDYFDTVITITGYENSQEEFDAIANEMLNQFGEYHRLYSIYHRFNGLENMCTVNELVDGVHRTVTVDRRIIDLLLYAKEMHTKTDGIMNIAMGSVLSLWHDYRTIGIDNPAEASLPPMDKLQSAAEHTDINNLIIDEANSTVFISDPLMKLDVGALAKGYAVDRIAQYFEQKGITNYVLNAGGNVRALGGKADGSDWKVGIENPNGGDYLSYININGYSVVTSGSYQRFYYVDGKPYHHIIHPDTLMPAKGYLSVSIICKNSGLGDALSTALFCLPLQEGMALIDSIDDTEAMWVTEDGKIALSCGWNSFVE